MKFTDQLHEAASNLWQESQNHPFVSELQSGELPMAKFRFYLLQDRYYLNQFAQFHEQVAAESPNEQLAEFLRARGQDLKDSEIAMRNHLFQELKITAQEIAATPIAPTAYNYVNHLFATLKNAGVAPAVAAIVPCYWLYQEIGQKMAAHGSPVKYYREWIDTYDGAWYEQNVAKILAVVDQLAETSSEEERQQMQTAFVRSSYYELHFWQMAYEEQAWA